MSIDDILCAIRSYSHTGFVEVTGGEPLLQPDVYDLFRILHKSGYKILCETNGSLDIGKIPAYVCRVVDVKTPGSGCPDSFMVSNLTHINHHHDNLKFVIDSLDDYEWMKGFLMSHGLWGSHILVSCVEKNINPAIIAQKILSDGLDVRLQIQLHKYIGLK
jgi:7-carboxy-7-deazaguanine synthase